MVPEGLPVAMTIALAVGMQRMARRGALVRRLAAVETLGSTSVICSDKTGTLTCNAMTVTRVWTASGHWFEVSGVGYAPEGEIGSTSPGGPDAIPGLERLLASGVLCNDASLTPPVSPGGEWQVLGDPTEAALLVLAMKRLTDLDRLRATWVRESEIPFDSTSKMMATGHRHADGRRRVVLKGAPEALLPLCNASAGASREAAEVMAGAALRVLALADVEGVSIDVSRGFEQFRDRVRLLGLVGQIDPAREDVAAAIHACRSAGVRTIMVTGDHKATGLAVARQLGIVGAASGADRAVDGRELEAMGEYELREALPTIAVFARVHPAQKLRIVEALQAEGEVVAMTGDGVNDGPALARADVGVAMGLGGTEVAKQAAKIVVTDDSFASIVRAVEEGRLAYRNLKKVILYLFATSLAEIAVLVGALLLGYPLPLAAVQILWINLVTEGTVTVNLIMEPAEGDEMRQRPIPIGEPLLNAAMLKRVALMTPTMAAVTLGWFVWRFESGIPFEQVQTETFTVLAVSQWFNVLNCQSASRSSLSLALWRNPWLLAGLGLGVLLQLAVLYLPPLNALFHTVPLTVADLLPILAMASLVLWLEEARKGIVRRGAGERD